MKVKLSLIFCSLLILCLIPLLENNFGAPVTLKRWAPLSWDDFQGIARPFSTYAAGINSYIYLEYDSVRNKHHAYAAQNNQKSWVKRALNDPDYVLNHEQYHFNISEVHARILNTQLATLGSQDPYELLQSQRSELMAMQEKFDNETNHGIHVALQRKWEYQIDSMLWIHQHEAIQFIEPYSGAEVFFPITPTYLEEALENGVYKSYSIFRYDMNISLMIFIFHDLVDIDHSRIVERKISADSLVINSFERKDSPNGEVVEISAIDTLRNIKEMSQWYYSKPYVFQLYADYPMTTKDTIGYEQIADSFFSSFKIVDTDHHFLSKSDSSSQTTLSMLTKYSNINPKDSKGVACMILKPSRPHSFFRGPIINADSDALFAIDIIEHDDSLLLRNIMVIDDLMFDSKTVNGDQMVVIPDGKLSKHDSWISFGYLLHEDSSKTCYDYHNQVIHVDSQALHSKNIKASSDNRDL